MPSRNGWRYDRQNNRLEVQVGSEVVAYFPGRGGEFTPLGSSFYVDERDGSDDYNGLSPQTAKETIAAAIGLCTTGQGDYVFALNAWTVPDAPLTISKTDIHLIGIGSGNFDNGNDMTCADNNTSTVLIESAGYDFELAGFNLSSSGTSGVALELGEGYRLHLHHLTFGCNIACTTGISGNSFTHSTISDCLFGTLVAGNSMYTFLNTSIVRNNRFLATAGVCISAPGGSNMLYTIIEDNKFLVDDAANGDAITIPAAGTANMIINNYAANGMLNSGYSCNPYRDLAANTANHWSMNYRGNEVIEPVGV